MFSKYSGKAENIVIICGKWLNLTQFSQLFKMYSEYYLFEVERVMQNDNVVCSIIYASASLKFLRIEKESLVDFYLERLITFKKNYEFSAELLNRLIEEGLQIPMTRALIEIETMKSKLDDIFGAFYL